MKRTSDGLARYARHPLVTDQGRLISELILEQSSMALADAIGKKKVKEAEKQQRRWANEIKRRLALKHMLIDYDDIGDNFYMVDAQGHLTNYASQWFEALPENAKRAAFAHMDAGKGGGGRKVSVSPDGRLGRSAPKALVSPDGKLAPPTSAPMQPTAPTPSPAPVPAPSQEQQAKKQFGLPDKKEKSKSEKRAKFKYDPTKDPTGSTLYKIVSRMGGISRSSLAAQGFDIPALLESKLSGLFPRSGGMDLDQLANELHSQGHIQVPGVEYHGTEGMVGAHQQRSMPIGAGEYVLNQIEGKAKSLLANQDAEYEKEYKAYVKEIQDAERAGIQRGEIETAVRAGEEIGISEEEKGDAWEGVGGVAEEEADFDPSAFGVTPEPAEQDDTKPSAVTVSSDGKLPAPVEQPAKPSMLDKIRAKQMQGKPKESSVQPGGKIHFVPHPNQRDDETTVSVDVSKLDSSWSKNQDEYLPKDGKGKSEVSGRRESFEDFLKTGQPIQASRGNIHDGAFSFMDGRHRFAVMRDKGIKEVSVTVPKSQAKEIHEKFGKTDSTPVEQPQPAQKETAMPQQSSLPAEKSDADVSAQLKELGLPEYPVHHIGDNPDDHAMLEKAAPNELKAWRRAMIERKTMPNMDDRMKFRKSVLAPAFEAVMAAWRKARA